jgi:cytochrome c5
MAGVVKSASLVPFNLLTRKGFRMQPFRPVSPLAAFSMAVAAAMIGGCEPTSTVDPDDAALLVKPVARVEFQKAPTIPPGNRSGEEIYAKVCTTCHATGTLGAPPTGDYDAWAARIETGFDALVKSVIDGKGNMPVRAGGADLTDVEVQRAVAYLVNQAGADFTEPPREQ